MGKGWEGEMGGGGCSEEMKSEVRWGRRGVRYRQGSQKQDVKQGAGKVGVLRGSNVRPMLCMIQTVGRHHRY